MSNLVSAAKSLLTELSSGTKYEYIIGLKTELARIAYSVLNIIYTNPRMDYGQLVPKTSRTQDNSYPRQLVPKTSRTQDNS